MNQQAPLWTPSQQQIEQANLSKFMAFVSEQGSQVIGDYDSLYQWSIDDSESFWSLLWDFCEVKGDKGDRVLIHADEMELAQWFPDARLNFAENLLRRRDDETAIYFRAEDQVDRELSFKQLYDQVAAVAAWLKAQGMQSGDRVAAYLPNMPETIVAMLATTSLGAIWTSTSPDFGEDSVIDRFGQTEPKVLFCCDGYFYNGKVKDTRDKARRIMMHLPSVQQVVEIPLAGLEGDPAGTFWLVTNHLRSS